MRGCRHCCGEEMPCLGCPFEVGFSRLGCAPAPATAGEIGFFIDSEEAHIQILHRSFRLERFGQVPIRIICYASNKRYLCRSRFPCDITILAEILMHLEQGKSVSSCYLGENWHKPCNKSTSSWCGVPVPGGLAGPVLPCLAGAMPAL